MPVEPYDPKGPYWVLREAARSDGVSVRGRKCRRFITGAGRVT